MTEKATIRPNTTSRTRRTARTADGVILLEPVGRPRHFTVEQIRRTVRELRDERSERLEAAKPAE